jgi:hypothetical protein
MTMAKKILMSNLKTKEFLILQKFKKNNKMELNINIPSVKQPNPLGSTGLKKELDSIYNKYKSFIDKSSEISNVPKEIILSMIFVESNGKNINKPNVKATGLMQVDAVSANDLIWKESKAGRLNSSEELILRKQLGQRLDKIKAMPYMGKGLYVTKEDLTNEEFNITVGTIIIGILIDKHTKNGKLNLAKVIVNYNKGYFAKVTGNTPQETLDSISSSSPTHSYIRKILGIGGTLDILI